MPLSHQTLTTHKTQLQQPLHVVNSGSMPVTSAHPTTYLQEHPTYRGYVNQDITATDPAKQSTFPQSLPSAGADNASNPNIAPSIPAQHPAQPYHSSNNPGSPSHSELPPLKPVFGVSLDELFIRDSSAVPVLVHQCLQAVDLFGLEVEGIYRTSGTASHISKLRAIFNNGKRCFPRR